ncbi:MAG TPA: hypothetical protein VME17_10975 [Bryobacteraceae bacterium]|nr:hypothetical protein [Bryobacteraceae bacterium]
MFRLLRRLFGMDVPFGLLIELVLALLPAETVLLAIVGTGGERFILIYLLSANRVFRHGWLSFL